MKNKNLPIDWNHLWQNRLLCRTWYCKYCYARGYPKVGMRYVVYSRSTGDTLTRLVNNLKNREPGFIPSLIELVLNKHDDYYCKDGIHVAVKVTCGAVGCGITLLPPKDPKYSFSLEHKRIFIYRLKVEDVIGLIRFNNSGFEMNYNNELKWKLKK